MHPFLGALGKSLREHPLKPWFNPLRGVRARLVRGSPWLEDLYRFPSSLVKVEYVPAEPAATPEELSEEDLFSLFRRFGKIAQILPQPTDSKVSPRYAQLVFPSMRDAIMARNCMHGLAVDEALAGHKQGTRLRLSYEARVKPHSIWNWLTNHPRIVIPAIAALLAGVSVMVFDPIREFFIKMHIRHSLNITDSRIYKWFKSQTGNLTLGRQRGSQHEAMSSVWSHRRDLIEQLRCWLEENSDTFIVITGPRGSGKLEMVRDQSLEGRKNVLMFDSKPIVDARGEAGTIGKLAAAVGYRPVFSWANSVSSMVDLAVQSTTGVKAGFSETFESQLNKILHATAAALKDVALGSQPRKGKESSLSEDAYLEAHPEKRPIVVIDNFLHKSDEMTLVYDKIAEWAASLVQNNVAHVIFLTSDSSFSKPLSKALPDRVFRTLSLGDLDPAAAKHFVLSRLEEDLQQDEDPARAEQSKDGQQAVRRLNLKGLDRSIQTLGGRLTDLEFLTRRIKTGQSPSQACDDIVNESATDTVKMFLYGKTGETDKKWSRQQAWYLIKSLAANPQLRYNQVLLSPTFSSSTTRSASNGEAALESLADAELISIKFSGGRPQTITAGKPLHQAAFGVLVGDAVLKAKMDLGVLGEMAKVESGSIDTVEAELALLGRLPKQTAETGKRIVYLLEKLDASQRRIAQLDNQMGCLKKVLQEDY